MKTIIPNPLKTTKTMVTIEGNKLHITLVCANAAQQKADIIKALGKTVQWYSCLEDKPEADEIHLNTIGQLIEQMAEV